MSQVSQVTSRIKQFERELTELHARLLTAMGVEHKMLESQIAQVIQKINSLGKRA